MVPAWAILDPEAMEESWNLRETVKNTLAQMHTPPTIVWNFKG